MSDQTIHRPLATIYGYPRQGADRELKKATEAYWAGRLGSDELLATAHQLRLQRINELQDAGIDEIPSNDFSFYDHVLDATIMLGAIPSRHRDAVPDVETAAGTLDRYFAMARGTSEVEPLEMTKWFTTNYHYLVPELGPDTTFNLDATKPLSEFIEAQSAGVTTRPVVLGPLSFLLLAKREPTAPLDFTTLDLLDRVLPSYLQLLQVLHDAGARWVQFDEPVLVTDQPPEVLALVQQTYRLLASHPNRPKILVASYFDQLGDALPALAGTPVEGLAMDFTGPGAKNLETLAAIGGLPGKRLVAGVIDGHNVWSADLETTLSALETLRSLASQLDVAPSCSLLHVPLDVNLEVGLDPLVKPWLSFARQKLSELVTLARGLADGRTAIESELRHNQNQLALRASSPIVHANSVRERTDTIGDQDLRRGHAYRERHDAQQRRLNLPLLPTTTIGSFPQTKQLRKARAELASGKIDAEMYERAMRDEIRAVIKDQEDLGLDVLVHGEPERNDMVQYFAEQLDGFLTTTHGWVQSYGTRYVRPPIIVGDVSRPAPMTLRWTTYAQSLTDRPVKGMLTGPVTMLAWSFVRNDQPLRATALQVALALRDEVDDLERAGVAIIQVDEPALRETLPLRQKDRAAYLDWAVQAFRLTTSGVRDDTQIHTHMCYAEFGDVLTAMAEMDADVISLEAARSQMAIVADLTRGQYPNDIGPGVWDIHSPRVPSVDEITERLEGAIDQFPVGRIWVNPDCGLKTRDYQEVQASLANLVAATDRVRSGL